MKKRFLTLLLIGLVAAALAGSLLSTSQAPAPAFLPASGPADYLRTTAAALPPLLPPVPAPQRGPLATSVMPSNEPQCSVATLGDPDVFCSAFGAGTPVRCSAHCDRGQRCSSFLGGGGFGTAFCSVFGSPSTRCTVLPPIGSINFSLCSAFGDSRTFCSVNGSGTTRQTCSAENPGGTGNACSAFNPAFVGNQAPQCSVVRNQSPRGGFCSTANPGLKTCSAYGEPNPNGGPAVCSIAPGQRGACTAFKQAPVASCSVQRGPGFCSAAGSPLPVLPCRN